MTSLPVQNSKPFRTWREVCSTNLHVSVWFNAFRRQQNWYDVPQLKRRGESKCTSGRTNIDCNDIGVPTPRVRAAWVPPHARPCTVDDVEFYYLKLIQHLRNVAGRPLTLRPSDCYGPRWAGREAWVTYGDGRTRRVPANTARGSTPLLTLLPRRYHARIVKHYHAS
jgi:hypothetical protein